MAERVKHSASRRGHRAQMTRQLQKATDIMSKDDPLTQHEKDVLIATHEDITSRLEQIRALDEEILKRADETEFDNLFLDADNYVIDIKERIVEIRNFIQRADTPTTPTTQTSSEMSSTSFTSNNSASRRRTVNLPKLDLEEFSGDILSWQSFIDTFEAAIDKDDMLDEVNKFQYLRAHVKGEAAKVIEGLQLTNENYKHALELLKRRYGLKHKIRNAYMKALWELPKPSNDLSSLKFFYDNMESYRRGLEALGKSEDSYRDFLIPIILEKLPGNFRRIITRDHGTDDWSFKDLRESVCKEIEAMEAGEISNNSVSSFAYNESPMRNVQFSAQALHTNTKTRKPDCVFCSNSHRPFDCTNVTDHMQRFEIIKTKGLCFNCLSKGHSSRSCQSVFKCRKCDSKHHTTIHHAFKQSPKLSKPDTSSNTNSQKIHANSVSTDLQSTSGNVLLKTAITQVYSDKASADATILFDEGATRSFISEKLAEHLHLTPDGQTSVQISTFGNKKSAPKRLNYVTLTVKTTWGPDISISTLIVPEICNPINNHICPAVLNLPHIKGLQLAHPAVNHKDLNISLLIGADHYWSFVGDKTIKGNGPTAVSSRLGYLLSEPTSRDASFPTDVTSFHVNAYSPTDDPVTKLWDFDTIGICEPANTDSTDDKADEFETFCEQNIEKRDKQYFARLPWKENHPVLPTNRRIVEKRTRHMVRKLPSDLLPVYDRIIKEQEHRGFIERLDSDNPNQGHYLLHHAVKKDSPTTPIRIVYDCSCNTCQTPSLNDCLDKGPMLLNDLAGILLRFRTHPIALVSDLEKAFLHVALHEEDREFTKFLWLSDPTAQQF
ncbi:uncharacterized protein LOC102803144 [Saccoglossus kowalevskii]|uniref:Uncharacterized protein LOC102803144 n=1 Tax=Saccoglossus kowalevskii TaxID=10224 RepID=A0ABM0MZN9_SACKO|nr:PREDICTED: uncharacterized protein LOC102803144 [Saccoglossus kowalevskii]